MAIYNDIGVVIIMLGLHAPIADKRLAGMVFELGVQRGIGVACDKVVWLRDAPAIAQISPLMYS